MAPGMKPGRTRPLRVIGKATSCAAIPPIGSQGGITPQRPTQPLSVLPAPPPAPAAHLVLPRLQFVEFVVSDEFEFILQHECGQYGYENQNGGLLLTSDISAGALYWKVPVTFFCVVRSVIWLIGRDMADLDVLPKVMLLSPQLLQRLVQFDC